MGFTQLLRKIATGTTEQCELKLIDDNKESTRNARKREKAQKPVYLTADLKSFMVQHKDQAIEIKRQQDPEATINPRFAKVSRPCPPFCVQPINLATGVQTIGELEMFAYLQQATNDDSIMIVDSRIAQWVEKGTIPSATHIPWTSLARSQGASTKSIVQILRSQFGVQLRNNRNCGDVSQALNNGTPEDVFDFSQAKILIQFCNGNWCAQTPESIEALLSFGYPADKLKYYRDGMQGWESLGLTTIKEDIPTKNRGISCDSWFVSIK